MSERSRIFLIGGLIVFGVAIFGFILMQQNHKPEPDKLIAPPIVISTPTPTPSPTPEAVVFVEPEPTPTPEPTVRDVATLNTSDEVLKVDLNTYFPQSRLLALLTPDEILRKAVRATHGLSEGYIVKEFRPVQSPKGVLSAQDLNETGEAGERYYQLLGSNAKRYAPFFEVLNKISPEQAAQLYRYYYPLLQDAYDELGIPDKRFIDVTRNAIKHFLKGMPEAYWGETKLVRTSVMYQFANPAIEAENGVTKLRLRIGRENDAQLRAWLKRFLKALSSR